MNIEGQTEPADTEAEAALIGCMILDPDVRGEILEALTPDAFSAEKAAACFGAMGRTLDAGPEDFARDAQACGVTKVDLIAYCECVPHSVNWPHYLRRVREAWCARRLWRECHTIAHELGTRHTWDATVEAATKRVDAAASARAARKTVTIADAAQEALRRLDEGLSEYHKTGWEAFDKEIGGWPRSGLVTVIAPPSHGKSTWVVNAALHISQSVPVRMFSFEMPARRIAETAIAIKAARNLRRHSLNGTKPGMDEWRDFDAAALSLQALQFELEDDHLDAHQIYARCHRYKAQGVGVVIVDYLQNLPNLPGTDTFASVTESAKTLQRIARQLGLCVVMVCQGDKESVKKKDRPLALSDAYGGIVVDQVTDLGISLFRPGFTNPEFEKGLTQIHVVKNKYGETTGMGGIEMWFDGQVSTFREWRYSA